MDWFSESARLLLLGHIARTCLYERRREPFANIKHLKNVIRDKWHDVDHQTIRKAILQWKKRLAAVAKQNGGPIHLFGTFSANQLTDHITVTFWCGLRMSDDMNDELLANIVL